MGQQRFGSIRININSRWTNKYGKLIMPSSGDGDAPDDDVPMMEVDENPDEKPDKPDEKPDEKPDKSQKLKIKDHLQMEKD